MAIVKSYKGFNLDMTCRGFQYEEGSSYEIDNVDLCRKGFHGCEHPNDVLGYYLPSRSVYHKVIHSGQIEKSINDSKLASTNITIKEPLGITDMAKGAMHIAEDNRKEMSPLDYETVSSDADLTYVYSGGMRSIASASGRKCAAHSDGSMGASITTASCSTSYSDCSDSISASTGDWSLSCSEGGERCVSCTTGDESAIECKGYRSISCSTGNDCHSSSTNARSAALTTGDDSYASTDGSRSTAIVVGRRSCASVGVSGSLAVAFGEDSCAKGVKGSLLLLTEWFGNSLIPRYKIVSVDGEIIKENTAYALIDGVVVEVNPWGGRR